MTRLSVSEIYASIQGESSFAGWPCVFVRLAGCPLRCRWCDTAHAFRDGRPMELDAVLAEVDRHDLPLVEVTGGEPLAQPGAPELLARLAERGGTVLLETSGALPIAGLDPRVRVILDLKAPGSGEEARNHRENLLHLDAGDELKIVIADRDDYEWGRRVIEGLSLPASVPVHFSPVHGELDPRTLAKWLLEDRLPVHLQLQLHKYIWDPEARGV